MNLKEAFRYQNFLDSMLNGAISYLSTPQNVIEYTHVHMRPETISETEDHEQIFPGCQLYDVDEVVAFIMDVMQEKEFISLAVTQAKQYAAFAVDHEIALNKTRQLLARAMNTLARIKTNNRMIRGSGFRFNAEGNQVTYFYDIEETQRPRFDRAAVKDVARELLTKADQVSNEAEKFMVETIVEFTPAFDVNDTFDEVFQAYHDARQEEIE